MKFIETPLFTKEVQALLEDDEYKSLQIALLLRPEQGSISLAQVDFELLIYSKSKKDDLSQDQLRILNQLIKEELK